MSAPSQSPAAVISTPTATSPPSVTQTPVRPLAPVKPTTESISVSPQSDFTDTIKPFTADAFANGFCTLVGALLGAMLAYALQRRFQRSLEQKSALVSAHRLMFSLLQQINTIVLIQRDYVHEELENPARFLSIPAVSPFDTKKNTLELPELAFLLDTREGRTILYEFYIAQENYIEALNQWNLRSALHLEKVQPALAAMKIESGALLTEAQIKDALGVQVFGSIVNSTNGCIELLKRAFKKLADAKEKTRAYLVHRFKTNDFTDFDFPDTYGLLDKTPADKK